MKTSKLFSSLAFILYILVLFRLTVFRGGWFTHGWLSGRVEWVPFVYLAKLVRIGYWRYFVYLFLGNLFWFVPLGMALKGYGKPFFPTCLLALALSATIELLQFVLGSGVSEVEDLILNTAGAALGYGCTGLLWRKRGKASNKPIDKQKEG